MLDSLKNISVILCALIFVACAKNNDNNSQKNAPTPQGPTAQNLEGKSTDEVLQTKYNKAELVCNLWTQFGGELNKSNPPNDSFSVDLLKVDPTQGELKLSGKSQDQTVDVSIQVNALKISHVHHTDVDGTVYIMEHTPVIEYAYSYEESAIHINGATISGQGSGQRSVNEKLKDVALNFSSKTQGDIGTYFRYLDCSIETDIKPEYQDQFKVQKKN